MANLRLAYAYQMVHPGKKLLFMGQELDRKKEWNEKQSLSWELLEDKEHLQLKNYMAALYAFYKANPALYQLDEKPEGFEWINGMEWEKNLLIFLRRTRKKKIRCLSYATSRMSSTMISALVCRIQESTKRCSTVMQKLMAEQASEIHA